MCRLRSECAGLYSVIIAAEKEKRRSDGETGPRKERRNNRGARRFKTEIRDERWN